MGFYLNQFPGRDLSRSLRSCIGRTWLWQWWLFQRIGWLIWRARRLRHLEVIASLLEGIVAHLEGMEDTEAMGMARGQQIPAMVTVDTVATEAMAMGVIVGVMAAIATMAEANQIQMMMSRILRESQ